MSLQASFMKAREVVRLRLVAGHEPAERIIQVDESLDVPASAVLA